MTANDDLPPAASAGQTPTARNATSRRVLDPVSHASEGLFDVMAPSFQKLGRPGNPARFMAALVGPSGSGQATAWKFGKGGCEPPI